MLDQMVVTLMEGAFVCVGFPYVAKLCRNVLDSLLKGRLKSLFFSFFGPFSFAWIKQQGEVGIFSFFSINADKSTQSGKYVKTYIFEISHNHAMFKNFSEMEEAVCSITVELHHTFSV